MYGFLHLLGLEKAKNRVVGGTNGGRQYLRRGLVPPSYPLGAAFLPVKYSLYHEKKILLRDFWVGFEVFFRVGKAQKHRNWLCVSKIR